MSAAAVAVQLGAAVLPTLIEEITNLIESGVSEEEATRAALERLGARELPAPVSAIIRERYARARAEQLGPAAATPALPEVDRKTLGDILSDAQLAAHLSPAQRDALQRITATPRT